MNRVAVHNRIISDFKSMNHRLTNNKYKKQKNTLYGYGHTKYSNTLYELVKKICEQPV